MRTERASIPLILAMAAAALLAGCAGYYPASNQYPGSTYPGGYGDPGYGNPQGYPAAQGVLRCESEDGRIRRCPADVRGGVRLSQQLSRTACVQGRTWGYDAGGIWVNGGCRGEFVVGGGYGGYGSGGYGSGSYGQQVIRCESEDGREHHCAATLRGATLQRQISRTPCVQGRNWRWDQGGIWVKDGCRGEFAAW
jgi:hypothetical protein